MKTNPPSPLSLGDINGLKMPDYARCLGGVLANSPHLAARTWYARPFRTLDDVHRSFVNVVRTLSESEQVTLIKSHPDFLEKNGNFSNQALVRKNDSDPDPDPDPDRAGKLALLNRRYTQRFGFPFILQAQGRAPGEILAAMESRLPRERPVEMISALDEICAIAKVRIEELFGE